MTLSAAREGPVVVGTLPRLGPSASLDEALALLRRDGALIIEGALDPATLDRVDVQLAPWFDAARPGEGPFFGRRTRRFCGLFAKAPACADLALHPLVLPLMETLLRGEDAESPVCDAIELNLTQAIGIGPGEPGQVLHRDEDLWPFPRNFEVMANAMWVLDDFTAENGATRVIPGSHRWPRDREPRPGEAVVASAPRGSVILWLGGALHGGGANHTDRVRRGVVMSYRLGWLASGERLLLSIPPEIARRLPERLQRLIGYQIHRPNLGWIEGQDPLRWLNGEIGALAAVRDNLSPRFEAALAAVLEDPDSHGGYLQ